MSTPEREKEQRSIFLRVILRTPSEFSLSIILSPPRVLSLSVILRMLSVFSLSVILRMLSVFSLSVILRMLSEARRTKNLRSFPPHYVAGNSVTLRMTKEIYMIEDMKLETERLEGTLRNFLSFAE